MEPEERVGSPGASGLVYALLCSVFRTVRDLDMAWEPFWGAIRRRVVRSLGESGRSLAQVNGTLGLLQTPSGTAQVSFTPRRSAGEKARAAKMDQPHRGRKDSHAGVALPRLSVWLAARCQRRIRRSASRRCGRWRARGRERHRDRAAPGTGRIPGTAPGPGVQAWSVTRSCLASSSAG